MFQSIEEIVAAAEAESAAAREAVRRTLAEVPPWLDREIAAGRARSSCERTRTALRSLLKVCNLTPEGAPLDLAWFDRTFPPGGWNPVAMPRMGQGTYEDYRARVRAAIEEVLGIAPARAAARARRDGWSELAEWLEGCPEFEDLGSRRLIPLRSSLTMAARLAGLEPGDLTDNAFRALLDGVHDQGARESLRRASALIARLQADPARGEVWRWLPHPIAPIEAGSRVTHDLPEHFLAEIEEMTEVAARLRYVTVKQCWEHVAAKTRDNYRNTLRALAGALAEAGRIAPEANGLRPVIEDPAALAAALRVWLGWLEAGRWAESTAIRYAGRLPCILERNGIDVAALKGLIDEVDEFHDSLEKRQMGEETRAFCRALIERPDFRADFLLSHIPPRKAAEAILRAARARPDGRLSASEATRVRQLGTVALFCAIECGGAPVRVDNFLAIPSDGPGAWLKAVSPRRYELTVPAGRTKNRKRIWAPIEASRERYHDTVSWFMKDVRPLYLVDPATGARAQSPWLVPAVMDPGRPLPYDTFRGWFLRIMRDHCGVVCTPHNFRHGQASLLYHDNPGLLRTIARRLGDTERTVTETYAWVHEEIEAERGQAALVATMLGKGRS